MSRKLVGIKKASEILDIKKSTLYQWVYERRILHYKVGGCIKFDPVELDTFIEQCRVQPARQR